MDVGLELSHPIEAQIDVLVNRVLEGLARWGYQLRPFSKVDVNADSGPA
mgnify:CR=1 FL=1